MTPALTPAPGPRVVLATDRAVAGGAQRSLALLAPALRDLGWHVEALVGEPGPLVDELGVVGIAVTIDADADALAGLAPDAVLSVGASSHAWAGAAAHRAERPAAWWLELTLRGRPAEAAALAVPAAVAAAPTPVAAALLAARLGAPDLPVEVISPGADAGPVGRHRAAVAATRASIGLAPDPHEGPALLVLVARLDPIKGQDVAIDATAHLVAEGRDVHLALVGGAVVGHEGDLADRLQQQARRLGIADRVHHLGHRSDPGPWHAASTVAVHASAHEAFGLGVVEALAHGVPVVASATDGPRWILDAGRYGGLTAPGDVEELASAIGALLDDPEARARLARTGPERAATFTPQVAAARWDAVLRDVVRARCGHAG